MTNLVTNLMTKAHDESHDESHDEIHDAHDELESMTMPGLAISSAGA
jgi:hypothetical protein